MVRPIAQREIALLSEDLAGGRCLRAVGHLLRRDDDLPEVLEKMSSLGQERVARRGEAFAIHVNDGTTTVYARGHHHEELTMAIEIDPVCGMEVDTSTSQLSLEHEGTTYWFCGKGCLLDFEDDPEAFLPASTAPPA